MKKMLGSLFGLIVLATVFLAGFALGQTNLIPKTTLKRLVRSATGGAQSDSDDRSEYYRHKKSFFEKHGRQSRVVFVGDSLTCNADWQELFPGLDATNRGIISDRTDGVYARIDSILSTNAHSAFVMIGFNDLNNGFELPAVFGTYEKIVNELAENGMRVYVQSTLLAGTPHAEINPMIMRLNELLENLCRDNEHANYIELNHALAIEGRLRPEYSLDGVHLNGDGYAAWRDVITDTVSEVSASDRATSTSATADQLPDR